VVKSLYQYPFTPRRFSLGEHSLSYLDQGKGPAVVMVHGNPSWSYLYRNLVTALEGEYRCIVPDHLGCGLSDKPAWSKAATNHEKRVRRQRNYRRSASPKAHADLTSVLCPLSSVTDNPRGFSYRLSDHIENLERLLDHLNIKRCVLVVHDWGGAIGMGWAGRHPERVAGLVVLNTAAFFVPRLPLRIAVCRWPFIGALLVRGGNVFARAATSMAVSRKMDPRVAADFLAPYDSWAKRLAIHRFVQDIPMEENHPSRPTLVRVEESLKKLAAKPMLICWGGRDFCFNRTFYEQWRRRFPAARAHYFVDSGHYVLEDALDEILPLVRTFLPSCLAK